LKEESVKEIELEQKDKDKAERSLTEDDLFDPVGVEGSDMGIAKILFLASQG